MPCSVISGGSVPGTGLKLFSRKGSLSGKEQVPFQGLFFLSTEESKRVVFLQVPLLQGFRRQAKLNSGLL